MEEYILENCGDRNWVRLSQDVNELYGTSYNRDSIRQKANRLINRQEGEMKKNPKTPVKGVVRDLEIHRLKSTKADTDKKYKELLSQIDVLNAKIEAFETIAPTSTHLIKPKVGQGKGEGTVVVLASDWHVEETVDSDMVSGKNEYNLSIAKKRINEFFQATHRLTEICGRDIQINNMVLALLGDFISGDIHEEMLETCSLTPVEAVMWVKNELASGIKFLLENNPTMQFTIPCHSGNHARTTKDRRHATEAGHSLEYIMYHYLAEHFANEKRVKFLIPRGYHSFVQVYDMTIRFHHGHNIRYAGGVGGPTIAVNKAIAQWNKTRWADLDCFGHLHTRFDGGNFIMNGSNIGFNAYAVSIKASFEKPSQQFFLVDSKRGRTCLWNISYSV